MFTARRSRAAVYHRKSRKISHLCVRACRKYNEPFPSAKVNQPFIHLYHTIPFFLSLSPRDSQLSRITQSHPEYRPYHPITRGSRALIPRKPQTSRRWGDVGDFGGDRRRLRLSSSSLREDRDHARKREREREWIPERGRRASPSGTA